MLLTSACRSDVQLAKSCHASVTLEEGTLGAYAAAHTQQRIHAPVHVSPRSCMRHHSQSSPPLHEATPLTHDPKSTDDARCCGTTLTRHHRPAPTDGQAAARPVSTASICALRAALPCPALHCTAATDTHPMQALPLTITSAVLLLVPRAERDVAVPCGSRVFEVHRPPRAASPLVRPIALVRLLRHVLLLLLL